MRSNSARLVVVLLAGSVFVLGVGSGGARTAETSGQVTISLLANTQGQPPFSVLISNFERVYPNITVNATYAAGQSQLYQLEATELAAGSAADLLATYPGCGVPISVCALAKAGELAPLIKEPWVKWSLPLVTSLDKHGQGLFAFTPTVAPVGVFTNDSLFAKLGLKVPQTFPQLLDLCRKATADGTVAVLLGGAGGTAVQILVTNLAVATLYGSEKQWPAELKAGTVSFDGTAGWHQALQEFIDMNNAGCFEPGVTGASLASVAAQFAQGQGLMWPGTSTNKGLIDAASPQFSYSFGPFPGGSAPNQTSTFLNLNLSLAVNADSSAQNQAAAEAFIDFVARPKQTALYAQIQGGLTQYEILKGQIPAFMSAESSVLAQHEYIINPAQSWWNANVQLALQQDAIGLITGQSTIDGVLNAMDAAWKQGPS